jgi:hypothetical protein
MSAFERAERVNKSAWGSRCSLVLVDDGSVALVRIRRWRVEPGRGSWPDASFSQFLFEREDPARAVGGGRGLQPHQPRGGKARHAYQHSVGKLPARPGDHCSAGSDKRAAAFSLPSSGCFTTTQIPILGDRGVNDTERSRRNADSPRRTPYLLPLPQPRGVLPARASWQYAVMVAVADTLRKPFLRYWLSSFLDNFGDGVRLAAFPLLAAQLTRSPAAIAAVTALQGLP